LESRYLPTVAGSRTRSFHRRKPILGISQAHNDHATGELHVRTYVATPSQAGGSQVTVLVDQAFKITAVEDGRGN